MLHIIWIILKILFLVILCILGILVIVLAAILFVPIRYRIQAWKEQTAEAHVRVSWLWHILSVRAGYHEQGYAVVRLFGIPIYDRNREKKKPEKKKTEKKITKKKITEKKKTEKRKPEKENTEKTEESKSVSEEKRKESSGTDAGIQKKIETGAERETSEQQPEKKRSIKSFFRKLYQKLKNIQYTIRGFCDRIKDMAKQVSYYKAVWESGETRRAFALCKAQLYTVWKDIRPGRLSVHLKAGFDDPSVTGQVLAVHGMLYPWIGQYVMIEPDFEHEILEGRADCRGKITVFVLLLAAGRIYFNQDIRYLLKVLKKESSEEGGR
ncbi:MAG: DUF2953 domain-containing protein [Lachnospiraceae bacterium]|nr:DUF2953 domain-containing protein [Lachnospiraceae bacterium]